MLKRTIELVLTLTLAFSSWPKVACEEFKFGSEELRFANYYKEEVFRSYFPDPNAVWKIGSSPYAEQIIEEPLLPAEKAAQSARELVSKTFSKTSAEEIRTFYKEHSLSEELLHKNPCYSVEEFSKFFNQTLEDFAQQIIYTTASKPHELAIVKTSESTLMKMFLVIFSLASRKTLVMLLTKYLNAPTKTTKKKTR